MSGAHPAKILLGSIYTTNVGTAAQTLAMGKLLYDQTGSISAFGAVIVFEYTITVATNLLGGSLSDRLEPLRACRMIDAVRGLLVLTLAIALGATGAIFLVFLISAVIQMARPFYKSSFVRIQLALIPPRDRAAFNGRVSATFQIGQMSGIALCALLMAIFDPVAGIALNGVSFMVSATLLGLLSRNSLQPEKGASTPWSLRELWGDWREALEALRRDVALVFVILASTLDLIMAAMINLLLIPITYAIFDGSTFWLGTLDALFAAGAIATGLLAARAARIVAPDMLPLLCMLTQASLFYALSGALYGAGFLIAMALFGACNSLSWSMASTLLHNRMEKRLRGRITIMRYVAGAVIGALALSILTPAEARGLPVALQTAGSIALVASIVPACAMALLRWGAASRPTDPPRSIE